MFEIKLVHPLATADMSGPESRYWESDVIRVHITRLHRWICDFSRLCESSPAAVNWDTFLLDKLASELATAPAGSQRPGSVNGQARFPQADAAALAPARSAKVAARCLEVDLLHQIGL